ncbi:MULTISPECIES: TIM-barrel domain-containing protein [unclassified Sphingobium]|uniref:glycoside hydrolase family 31 protein n=1 Tax=unclassified Sphingobium TaxID=2611147 RepID=UPI0035A6A124
MKGSTSGPAWTLSRRSLLLSGGAAVVVASPRLAARTVVHDLTVRSGDLAIMVDALSDRAFRVRATPRPGDTVPASEMLAPTTARPLVRKSHVGGKTRLTVAHARCEWDPTTATLSFYDGTGRLLLAESPGSRRVTQSNVRRTPKLAATQGFASPPDERLYGTGCFQDGHLDIRGLPRRLTQVNTQISQPFILSSKGYGLLWHNPGMAEINRPNRVIPLERMAVAGAANAADVTTSTGNARVERRDAEFTGRFSVDRGGPYAFFLDLGRKMSSRHYVEIDGVPTTDLANLWLPPTASFLHDLTAGDHRVLIRAGDEDAPTLAFAPVEDRTTWTSPVSDGIDYIVIAGPAAEEVMAGYHALLGPQPMLPLWALGYIHCRERFHSSEEILATAREFRRRKLPCDMMVQDWQYWGRYGWNAMRFDEANYPDPAGLVHDLHAMNMGLMLSVWSKVGKDTELGKQVAARDFYIPGTEWIDFFNPAAARFYADNQTQRLGRLGIDAWWQDATEPENDDLAGRTIYAAAGQTQPGEMRRNVYPLQVSRTVYEAQRAAFPDKRVMILTRSAAPGQQRYGAATWSGDIGNDWETLKRQIPAGLNMAAAGQPWWTVDAGGFFRPGKGQYDDPAYRERFLRWFQFACFLPMTRVHGYMTDTEFWRYGGEVERVARQFLELRYRLLPYSYALAADASARGMPLIRPLVFDFPDDPAALDEAHSYMFGPALHVAPVLAADARHWDVYLPRSDGGWYDFWTGARREGGRVHRVDAPIDRIPLHVRAGSILPLGAVGQSTAGLLGGDLDLLVWPGRDGSATLYEDDGTSYRYEQGASARIPLIWNDAAQRLTIAERKGSFPGMSTQRKIVVHAKVAEAGALNQRDGRILEYRGLALSVSAK